MLIEQVLNCQFKCWYKIFKEITFESVILELPDSVVQYLLDDGLVLPEGCEDKSASAAAADSDSENEIDWEADNTAATAEAPRFPEFNKRLSAAIARLGGEVFPKLNWSSPKDASWIALNASLKCTCPRDVFLLMKSSSFLAHDLVEPLMSCEDYDVSTKPTIDYYMVLRRWREIHPGCEFRCFVKENKLVAITQRNHSSKFPFLEPEKEEIVQDLRDFYKQHIADVFPDKSVVFDVYREKQGAVWLVDFNPFGEVTDALLFTWLELFDIDPSAADTLPLVRFVDVAGIEPHPLRQYGVPLDITHLTTGTDVHKLIDLMNLQIQTPDENTSEEETTDQEKT